MKLPIPMLVSLSLSLYLLASCGEPKQAPVSSFEIVTDIHQTMELIIDPAVDIIWNSAGSIITKAGEQELAPTTPAGWLAVEAAAAVLAESGNLLILPDRSRGTQWNNFANQLTGNGRAAMIAAQQKDAEALFEAGANIYNVCAACHNHYQMESDFY